MFVMRQLDRRFGTIYGYWQGYPYQHNYRPGHVHVIKQNPQSLLQLGISYIDCANTVPNVCPI
jgi:hypothetical protein